MTLFNQNANSLYRGDCLSVLDRFDSDSIDFIYIDPPFFSNRYYELIWKDRGERFSFEDRWKGGIRHYSDWLMERIERLFMTLKPSGSMVVHLDWHAAHYIKTAMDSLTMSKFQNEIIWYYGNKLGTGGNVLDRQHDTLLWFTKGDGWTFNPLLEPVKFAKPQPVTQKIAGKRIWLRDEVGNRVYKTSDKKRIGDVWSIPIINPMAKERLGYPTQKPIRLMTRVLESFTRPGDLVLDAFCGCGTTLVAAQLLDRKWIGIDISQTAIAVVQNRLASTIGKIEVHGLAKTIQDLKNLSWQDFQVWAVSAVFGRHSPRKISDGGIDGFTFLESDPIQVKQSERVGRPTIDAFLGVLQREKTKRGLMIALSFTSGAYEEVARAKREDSIDIELIEAQAILDGRVAVSQMH